MEPITTFKSHIEGKNADVTIFPDRVEWVKGGISGGKVALGVLTSGASLLKTGVSGKDKGAEVIPVKSISSVTSAKDGLRYTKVSVICSGNTIDFRVRHDEAKRIQEILTDLALGKHETQTAPTDATATTTSGPTPTEQLSQLAELRANGVLTEEEFAAQKAKILANM